MFQTFLQERLLDTRSAVLLSSVTITINAQQKSHMKKVLKLHLLVRVAGFVLLILIPRTSAMAGKAATTGPTPAPSISLEVTAGTPLRLYLTKRVWFHQGAALTARVIDPIWAFDRVVIPAGTMVEGNIASLEKVSWVTRARAMLGGDFTPLKRAKLSFRNLDFEDGRHMPVTVVPALGLDTIYIPRQARAKSSTRPNRSTLRGKLGQQVRQQYEAKRDSAIYFVRGQNKKEWIEEWLLGKLPYHPQLYKTRTRVDVVLSQPLKFGEATVQADQSKGFGQLPPGQQLADIRMLTMVTSADARNGEPVSGELTKPVFASDHTLVLPVGTTFTGKVTLAERARWFHRGGKLRFAFDRLDLPVIAGLAQQLNKPTVQAIQAQVAGIEANPSVVHVDSEGTAKATESKTRFIRPIIAGFVAARSADNDRDRSPSVGGTSNSNGSPNLSGRVLGGLSGFGLLGTAASLGPRAIGMSLGYYGLAWSIYSNVIARGKELVFEKNTAMAIRFGPDERRK